MDIHGYMKKNMIKEKIKIFKDFRDGNWRPALLTKTRAPITGRLIGGEKEIGLYMNLDILYLIN